MKTKQSILLGPPGVGVEAQATKLAERWHTPHVSMESLIQKEIEKASAIGLEARSYVESGEPLPDALAMKLIRRRFEQPDVMLNGWVLDGFPRTLSQAQAFDEWWSAVGQSAATVVYLKAMTGLLINRLATENGHNEPISTIRHRIARHQEETEPLLAYYQERSQLTTINSSVSFAEVANQLARLGQEEAGVAPLIQDQAELDGRLASEPLLVVECMATWCGSCKRVTPLIERLAEAYRDRVKVMKIDFDAYRQITKRFELQGLPSVLFFKDGELQETVTGVKSYTTYDTVMTRFLEQQP